MKTAQKAKTPCCPGITPKGPPPDLPDKRMKDGQIRIHARKPGVNAATDMKPADGDPYEEANESSRDKELALSSLGLTRIPGANAFKVRKPVRPQPRRPSARSSAPARSDTLQAQKKSGSSF